MPFLEKRLTNPTTLSTASATVYTVPTQKTTIVKQIVVTNVTANSATFTLCVGSDSSANAIFSNTTIAGNDSLIINLSQVLNQSEILTAKASANSALNFTASGVENDGPLSPSTVYLADGSVTTSKLADSSITTAKIAANAVTQAKLDTSIPLSGFRNKIINGGFDIWQRGTTIAGLNNSVSYSADRWCIFRSLAANYTLSRRSVTPSELSGFNYCARYQRTSGDTSVALLYLGITFESISVIPLAGKTVTLSFYARKGANFSGSILDTQIEFGTGTDTSFLTQPTSPSITNMSSTLTTSWQLFQQTVSVPSTSTAARIFWDYTPTGTAGTNDYFEITGVQLEVSSQITPFEQRPVATELALCQRYYEKSYDIGTEPLTSTTQGMMFFSQTSNGSSDIVASVKYSVPKRIAVAPTFITYTGTAGSWHYSRNGVGETAATMNQSYAGTNNFVCYINIGAAWTPGQMYGHWRVDAEI